MTSLWGCLKASGNEGLRVASSGLRDNDFAVLTQHKESQKDRAVVSNETTYLKYARGRIKYSYNNPDDFTLRIF